MKNSLRHQRKNPITWFRPRQHEVVEIPSSCYTMPAGLWNGSYHIKCSWLITQTPVSVVGLKVAATSKCHIVLNQSESCLEVTSKMLIMFVPTIKLDNSRYNGEITVTGRTHTRRSCVLAVFLWLTVKAEFVAHNISTYSKSRALVYYTIMPA